MPSIAKFLEQHGEPASRVCAMCTQDACIFLRVGLHAEMIRRAENILSDALPLGQMHVTQEVNADVHIF